MLRKIILTAGVLFFAAIGVGVWFSKEAIASKILFDIVIGIIVFVSVKINKK